MKLTDTQLVILNRAANRDDGLIDPEAISAKAPLVRHNILAALLKRGLLGEFDALAGVPAWRTDARGQKRGLVVTAAGKAALGIEDGTAEPRAAKAAKSRKSATPKTAVQPKGGKTAAAKPTPKTREGTKQAQLIALLKRSRGVTIDEASETFGWLSHTTRAAISHGIGKRLAMTITSEKDEKRGRVYRIVG